MCFMDGYLFRTVRQQKSQGVDHPSVFVIAAVVSLTAAAAAFNMCALARAIRHEDTAQDARASCPTRSLLQRQDEAKKHAAALMLLARTPPPRGSSVNLTAVTVRSAFFSRTPTETRLDINKIIPSFHTLASVFRR